MIIYHFCCARDMRGIRSKGIIKGVVYGETRINRPGKPGEWQKYWRPGWQWLTLDPEKSHQSWNTHVMLRYDRTEYRWTVEIPAKMEDLIYDRDRLEAAIPGSCSLFDGWDGSENWRVYHGEIPRRWLKKLEHWNAKQEKWEEVPLGR